MFETIYLVISEKQLTFVQDTATVQAFFNNPLHSPTNASVAL
jgi:hypothetical protein